MPDYALGLLGWLLLVILWLSIQLRRLQALAAKHSSQPKDESNVAGREILGGDSALRASSR